MVLAVLSITAIFVINSSYMNTNSGESIIIDAARRARERRAAAVQSNAAVGTGSIERSFSQPPLIIDFSQPETTKTLRLEGAAATQLICPATHPRTSTGLCEKINADGTRERALGAWNYQYIGNPMRLAHGWRVALSATDLATGSVPQMPNTQLTTQLEFASNGRVRPVNPNPENNDQLPVSWAIYFVNGNAARALLVADSGQVEICRWESDQWLCFDD